MDPTLAEIYGTNEMDEADVEKLAAAEAAQELADDDEIDPSEMTDEDVEAVAAEVLAAGSEEEEEEEETTEGNEKLAEADYMGRVMAHAYVQELRGIEKDAYSQNPAPGKKGEKEMKRGGRMAKAVEKDIAGAGKSAKKGLHNRIIAPIKRGVNAALRGSRHAQHAVRNSHEAMLLGHRAGQAKDFLAHHASKHKGALGLAGAGLVAGEIGRRTHKHFSKEASAVDTLAIARAQEILAENGIEPEQQEQGTKYDVLSSVVEQRAMEMLAEAGYVSEE